MVHSTDIFELNRPVFTNICPPDDIIYFLHFQSFAYRSTSGDITLECTVTNPDDIYDKFEQLLTSIYRY